MRSPADHGRVIGICAINVVLAICVTISTTRCIKQSESTGRAIRRRPSDDCVVARSTVNMATTANY
ncbi:MAG: hypothetical protein QM775_26220 [Pirellulales bacterium]